MAERFSIGFVARQSALTGLLAMTLTGCSGDVSSTYTDTGKVGVLILHAITGIGSAEEVPRQRVATIPYATLGARLGSSDQGLLVLASKSGDNLLWLGGKSVAITTRRGRIVQTTGFEHNLSGVQSTPAGIGVTESGHSSFLYDFAEQSRYGLAVTCSESTLGREQIVILGVPHDTNHVTEDCVAPELDWSFRNEYWSDTAGFVWRSRQYVAPDMDALELEVFRPAQ